MDNTNQSAKSSGPAGSRPTEQGPDRHDGACATQPADTRFTRARLVRIRNLAVPVVVSSLAGNALGIIDTAMVGGIGSTALAAVGLCAVVHGLALSGLGGIGAAIRALTARRIGENQPREASRFLEASLIYGGAMSLLLAALGWFVTPHMLRLINQDPALIEQGVPYMRALLVATPALITNTAFGAYWNGRGRTGLNMRVTIIIVVANILLDYILIYGKFGAPALGTLGAGIASAISLYLASLIFVLLAFWTRVETGFGQVLPSRDHFRRLLRLVFPGMLKMMFGAAAYMVLYAIIGLLGTSELAVTNVIFRVTTFLALPIAGVSSAAAILMGQALGRKDPADAVAWCRQATGFSFAAAGLLGLLLTLFARPVLAIFIHEPEVLAAGIFPVQLVGLTLGGQMIATVLVQTLMAAGDHKMVFYIDTSMQWLLYLPGVWLMGNWLGLLGIWLACIFQGLARTLVFWLIVRSGKWKGIHI